MKLLFIVVLSLLAVSYARGQTAGNHTSLGVGGSYFQKFLSVLKLQEMQLNLLFFDN